MNCISETSSSVFLIESKRNGFNSFLLFKKKPNTISTYYPYNKKVKIDLKSFLIKQKEQEELFVKVMWQKFYFQQIKSKSFKIYSSNQLNLGSLSETRLYDKLNDLDEDYYNVLKNDLNEYSKQYQLKKTAFELVLKKRKEIKSLFINSEYYFNHIPQFFFFKKIGVTNNFKINYSIQYDFFKIKTWNENLLDTLLFNDQELKFQKNIVSVKMNNNLFIKKKRKKKYHFIKKYIFKRSFFKKRKDSILKKGTYISTLFYLWLDTSVNFFVKKNFFIQKNDLIYKNFYKIAPKIKIKNYNRFLRNTIYISLHRYIRKIDYAYKLPSVRSFKIMNNFEKSIDCVYNFVSIKNLFYKKFVYNKFLLNSFYRKPFKKK